MNSWTGVFPQGLVDLVSQSDTVYAVPLTIERNNNLYYKRKIFEGYGLAPPQTLAEFWALCDFFRSSGITPLSLPAAGWVLGMVVFDNLMPAVSGGKYYMDFFEGRAAPHSEPSKSELTRLFDAFARVVDCSNVADGEMNWQTAADAVYDGSAAMFVMNDSAKAYFEGAYRSDETRRAPWVADVDFGVVPGLGSSGYFAFNSTVFVVPNGAPHPNAARAFSDVVASREAQVAVNLAKGELPARLDVESVGDFMLQAAFADFLAASAASTLDSPKLLPGYMSLTSLDFYDEVNITLLVFALGAEKAADILGCTSADYSDPCPVAAADRAVQPKDVEFAIAKLQDAYALTAPD